MENYRGLHPGDAVQPYPGIYQEPGTAGRIGLESRLLFQAKPGAAGFIVKPCKGELTSALSVRRQALSACFNDVLYKSSA